MTTINLCLLSSFVLTSILFYQNCSALKICDEKCKEDRLTACCKTFFGDSPCIRLCRYNTTSSEIANQGIECKEYLKHWMYCASGGRDNRPCCKKADVQNDCDLLCEGKAPKICNVLTADLARFLGCINRAKDILKCHKTGLMVENLWQSDHLFEEEKKDCPKERPWSKCSFKCSIDFNRHVSSYNLILLRRIHFNESHLV